MSTTHGSMSPWRTSHVRPGDRGPHRIGTVADPLSGPCGLAGSAKGLRFADVLGNQFATAIVVDTSMRNAEAHQTLLAMRLRVEP